VIAPNWELAFSRSFDLQGRTLMVGLGGIYPQITPILADNFRSTIGPAFQSSTAFNLRKSA
jgi:hypothetical protein